MLFFYQKLFLKTSLTCPANTKVIVEKIEKFWPVSFAVLMDGNKDLVRVGLHAQFQQMVNL